MTRNRVDQFFNRILNLALNLSALLLLLLLPLLCIWMFRCYADAIQWLMQ